MRSSVFVALLLALFLAPSLSAESPDPRLVAIDAKASYRDSDFGANYRVIQSKPGQGDAVTVLEMKRRDKASQFVLKILEPEADKGRGFFRDGAVIKKYNPVEKRFDTTTAKDQLRNSNIRLSDFMGATFSRDYVVQSSDKGVVAGEAVAILTLKANSDDVTFPLVKLWVSASDLIMRRADFSLSGQLLRTGLTTYAQVGTHWVPESMIIQDELRGQKVGNTLVKERTLVQVLNPKFTDFGGLTFSLAYLDGPQK